MKKRVLIFLTILCMLTIMGSKYQDMGVIEAYSEGNKTVAMDKPPFRYYLSGKAVTKKTSALNLKVKSSKANNITDDEEWFTKNKLTMNTYEVPNPYADTLGNVPDGIDTYWNDLMITAAFYDSSYIYCTYGSNFIEGYVLNVYDAKTLEIMYSLDFSEYRYAPDYIKGDYDYVQQKINWAAIKNNILYVSHSHSTYAKSSMNKNAYITAIDLSDRSILWRTKALVCNSYNFVIVNNVILCGYGFTAEPDYLYQLNISNGKVLKKTKVKSAISYIVKKGSAVYVRTYNTDYKFKIVK
ncbi:hypothetical protein [Anaeromicropila populeti]|uniref:PQQ-like domain-containing protein n=1 Tax=Anaeromicropila populeti TaxID=37658 RepID=A0A1I6JAL3_9FIRM|nr:hypothetical protein [Anaeromicropila populeti]SFR75976.1 hypothetical protein SAMN05661086_01508 [Anaeromicropila populeti]